MRFAELALGAVRDALGETVIVDPDGIALAVTAIVMAPDADAESFGAPLRAPAVILEILSADIAAAGYEIDVGTVIELASGERRVVKAAPAFRDPKRLVMTIETRAE